MWISTVMVAVFPFEIFWNVDFFYQLVAGERLAGLAAYMFDPEKTLFLRGLSLFHIFLPLIWLWYLYKWGYDPRAFKAAVAVNWTALTLSFFLTDPEESVNWVFHPDKYGWTWVSSMQWWILLMFVFPIFIYWPTHEVLVRLARRAQ